MVGGFEFQAEMIFGIMGKLREPSDGEIRRVVFVDIVFDDRDLVVSVCFLCDRYG